MKNKLKIAIATVIWSLLALPAAAQVDLGLNYASDIGLPVTDIRSYIASLIRAGLGFAGFFLVMQIMHGGFLYMTHGGAEEDKEVAVATLKNGIIGFIIVATSVSMARYVVDAVANATGGYLSF